MVVGSCEVRIINHLNTEFHSGANISNSQNSVPYGLRNKKFRKLRTFRFYSKFQGYIQQKIYSTKISYRVVRSMNNIIAAIVDLHCFELSPLIFNT